MCGKAFLFVSLHRSINYNSLSLTEPHIRWTPSPYLPRFRQSGSRGQWLEGVLGYSAVVRRAKKGSEPRYDALQHIIMHISVVHFGETKQFYQHAALREGTKKNCIFVRLLLKLQGFRKKRFIHFNTYQK